MARSIKADGDGYALPKSPPHLRRSSANSTVAFHSSCPMPKKNAEKVIETVSLSACDVRELIGLLVW